MKNPDMLKKLRPYLITAAIGLLGVAFVLYIKQIWTQTEMKEILHILVDAFFIPGVLITGAGLLVFASNEGTFDMLRYSVIKLFDLLRRDVKSGRYKDYPDYREARKEKTRGSAFLLTVGLAFIAISCVLLLVYSL